MATKKPVKKVEAAKAAVFAKPVVKKAEAKAEPVKPVVKKAEPAKVAPPVVAKAQVKEKEAAKPKAEKTKQPHVDFQPEIVHSHPMDSIFGKPTVDDLVKDRRHY